MAQTINIAGVDGVRRITGPDIDGPAGKALWTRADAVMPSGAMFMTRSARFAGYGVQPGFIVGSEGCRVCDVDGRSYIDLNCGNGPNLLGYRHPQVEAAARAQADKGDLMPYFPPVMIDFCERLLGWTDGFHWSLPVKAGSDATTLATRIARAKMQRDNVLLFQRAYHGSNAEQSLHHEGAPRDALSKMHRLAWNDVDALDSFPASEGEKVAAIMVNPIEQNPGVPASFASPDFVAGIHRFRNRTGALIICDDVRSGFRIHPQGSHKAIGLEPDMICLGKALGNGHAVGAIIGREPLREAAARILYTSTYVFSAVCMAAAISVLDIYERDNAIYTITRAGERLRDGILVAAVKHGIALDFSGPVSHPMVVFKGDPHGAQSERFAYEAAKRGLLFHSRLAWFLSAAHDDAAIDEAIAIADLALGASA